METIHKIGRRKTAVARVYISKGKGNITVNNRAFDNYFTTPTLRYKVEQPLALTDNEKSFDIKVNVKGGGITGQAEAVRLAIARAMCELNEENQDWGWFDMNNLPKPLFPTLFSSLVRIL